MTERPPPYVVGVAGGSGSGKTTVVRTLLEELAPEPVTVIHHDAYYRDRSHLDPEERDRLNFDHPDALETDLLVEHLEALLEGRPVETPVYDFETHTRTSRTTTLEPTRLIVVDGIMALADPDLRELMDLRVYVEAEADLRFIRRLLRDVEERGRTVGSVVEQYLESVRPMHEEFVEPSKRYADVIVPDGEGGGEVVEALVARLRQELERDPGATGL